MRMLRNKDAARFDSCAWLGWFSKKKPLWGQALNIFSQVFILFISCYQPNKSSFYL